MAERSDEEIARRQEEKRRKQEEKRRLREEKRLAKEALKAATVGNAGGFRFFNDGTVKFPTKPRAAVLDTHYFDGRNRKSLGGRGLTAMATGGLSLAASNNAGHIVVTIVTEEWTQTYKGKDENTPTKLHGLALQAKALREHGAASEADDSVPPPPVGPKTWADDPFGRHQHRYFDGTEWTHHVSDLGEASKDTPEYAAPIEYTGSEGVWADDPFGRFQYRYFDATGWTKNTSRSGDRFDDPPEYAPPDEALPPKEE